MDSHYTTVCIAVIQWLFFFLLFTCGLVANVWSMNCSLSPDVKIGTRTKKTVNSKERWSIRYKHLNLSTQSVWFWCVMNENFTITWLCFVQFDILWVDILENKQLVNIFKDSNLRQSYCKKKRIMTLSELANNMVHLILLKHMHNADSNAKIKA